MMIRPTTASPVLGRPARACACSPEPTDEFTPSGPTLEWGYNGHRLTNAEAFEAIPDEMPEFFRKGGDRLTGLASAPDRWKMRELPHLKDTTKVDHYLSLEQLEGHELPENRFEFLRMVEHDHLDGGRDPQYVGMLPYRMAELYENLTLDFALWRQSSRLFGAEHPTTLGYQQDALRDAGVLGHYVGDAAQPLHATVHHDGWDASKAPNPEHFRTRRGLHSEFETALVNQVANPAEIRAHIADPHAYRGNPLDWAREFVNESNSQVAPLYRLEARGELNPEHPGKEGVAFVNERLAKGAQNLRDLWYSAWLESASLEHSLRDPG
ncbi:MAG: hypothetical protein KC910_07000 [Candidatus Eremiobacteraeota bacterium]|nr:hypothetical protein [Candidatus Eremiobacteraeota bacterium]